MTASQRIRHLIKLKNYTIEAFAEKVGTTRSTLNQMFKNDTNPKLPLLQACLRQFPDLNPRWLILGEGEIWETNSSTNSTIVEEEHRQLQQQVKEMEDLLNGQVKKMEEQMGKELLDMRQRISNLEKGKS